MKSAISRSEAGRMTGERKTVVCGSAVGRARWIAGGLVLLLIVSFFSVPIVFTGETSAESIASHKRLFRLHEAGANITSDYDWLNSSSACDDPTWDYDGDGELGLSIRKNLPSQRWRHFWVMDPEVNTDVHILGNLSAHIWAASEGNESGTLMTVEFSDMTTADWNDPDAWTTIASVTVPLIGPEFDQFKMYDLVATGVDYVIPAQHRLVITITRGDSINDRLLVHYDKSAFDSYILMDTSSFISVDEVRTTDALGIERSVFSDEEPVTVTANVSNPFGTYEMLDAEVQVFYAGNGTPLYGGYIQMTLEDEDDSANPSWRTYVHDLQSLPNATLIVTVRSMDPQGSPSWLNRTIDVVAVDHFELIVPDTVTAMENFTITVRALDEYDVIVANWQGPVQFEALLGDGVTPATGVLGIGAAIIESGDLGQKTISNQTYDYSEEQIIIRVFSGSKEGFSSLMDVRSGPVVNISLSPEGPLEVPAGMVIELAAEGLDLNGMVNTTWTPSWIVAGALGSLTVDGLNATLEAQNSGIGYVNCTNEMTEAMASVAVTVNPSLLTTIMIFPSEPFEIRQGESIALAATGYDLYGNEVLMGSVMWSTTTSGSIVATGATATYTAGFIPEVGVIEANVGSVSSSVEVTVINAEDGPWLTLIPTQVATEDSNWNLSLSTYWHHKNGTAGLRWHVEDVNSSLYMILHDSTSEVFVRFFTQPDKSGFDVFRLWVRDENGFSTYQDITVSIQAVNDRPRFVNEPPTELYVKFDISYIFDYTYYVSDVDTPKSELRMYSSMPGNVFFDRVFGTFDFGERDGTNPYFEMVELVVTDTPEGVASDSTNSDTLKIVVRVTDDVPPDLNQSLPDIELMEGDMDVFAFDLDDYFYDSDDDYLVYTYGFHNIEIRIDEETHEVFISAPGEWSGTAEGTFTAVDPVGALKTDTVLVTVIAVNDAPSFRNPGSVHVRYDFVYNMTASSYVSDPDHLLSELSFSFSTPYIEHVSGRLELLFPASQTGGPFTGPYIEHVNITVSDPLGASSVCSFDVLVSDNFPPEVASPVPYYDFMTFLEDEYLNNSVNLNVLFSDEDDGDAELDYTVNGNENVFVKIYPDSSVNFTAATNWSGIELIEFRAIDPHGAWSSWRVTIAVIPVNDAPVALPIPNFVIRGDGGNTYIDISAYFVDSETPFTGLSFLALPAPEVVIVGKYLYVDFPDGTSDITITLQATDSDGAESNEVTFKVSLQRTWADQIGYPYTFLIVLMSAGIGGYLLARRMPRPFALENLFLIHNDGRLISHVTKEENTSMDKDVVSAMFTAVQEFVRDSFQAGELGLKKLEIGDKNVMIEKGNSVYLALIYSGWPRKTIFETLAMLLRDVEERYHGRIEAWNGTKKALPGIDSMLLLYMAKSYEPGSWQPEEEEAIREEDWVDIISKES